MPYRNGNYAAFYVAEPFNENALGAFSTPDFNHYQLLKAWKTLDGSFPFRDSHAKTYNVREGSSWEFTLKPRLRERLRESKNIVLFLSSKTKASRALTEEIEYGIGDLGLPVIVVYPEIDAKLFNEGIPYKAKMLWDNIGAFRRLMDTVPTLHVPMQKNALRVALSDSNFMIQTKRAPGIYYL